MSSLGRPTFKKKIKKYCNCPRTFKSNHIACMVILISPFGLKGHPLPYNLSTLHSIILTACKVTQSQLFSLTKGAIQPNFLLQWGPDLNNEYLNKGNISITNFHLLTIQMPSNSSLFKQPIKHPMT